MKKKMIGIGLLLVLTFITFYIVFANSDIVGISKLIHILNPTYLLLAILCMVLNTLAGSMIIYVISNEITDRINFRRAIYVTLIGQYYSAITPFASGGQPIQVMIMKNKYDLSMVKGTTITVKKFVMYHIVVTLFSLGMYFYSFDRIHAMYSPAINILIGIGLIVNFMIAVGLLMLSYTDIYIKKILHMALKLAHKVRLFKKTTSEEVNLHLDEYVKNLHEIKNNKKTMFSLFFLTFISLLLFFSVTYFVYLALGQSGAHYLDLISVQILVYMVASFVPTPGNAGASEGGFYVILQPFFNAKLLPYAVLIWRIITYYGVMLLSGLILVLVKVYESIQKGRRNTN